MIHKFNHLFGNEGGFLMPDFNGVPEKPLLLGERKNGGAIRERSRLTATNEQSRI